MGKWFNVFCVAINAKHSIAVSELMRRPTITKPRRAELINNLKEAVGSRKVISILFLSLATAGQKEKLGSLIPIHRNIHGRTINQ